MLNAQSLDQHHWEDRLLILVSSSAENEDLQNQVAILRTDEAGLEERKLIIYRLFEEKYQKGLQPTSNTQPAIDDDLRESFPLPKSGFGVYLVGLDGGTKLRDNKPVSLQTIFSLIDSMPMRRAEMRREQNRDNKN